VLVLKCRVQYQPRKEVRAMGEPKPETTAQNRQPVELRDLSQPVELLSDEQAERVKGADALNAADYVMWRKTLRSA
jgi:hypothetical protein